jgi:hypothetical protein
MQSETTEAKTDFAGRELTRSDVKRLSRPVFKTRYTPSTPAVEDALRGFVEPPYAYVLFERWRIELLPDASPVRSEGLFVHNVEGRPEQVVKIEFYLRKGFRILHWGNFHFLSDSNKESAKKAAMHANAWATLQEDLLRLSEDKNVRVENEKLKGEKDALLAKLAEYETKFGKKEKKEG